MASELVSVAVHNKRVPIEFAVLLCCQGNGVDVAMLLVGGGGGGCCCHGGRGPDGGGGGWLPGGGGGGGIIPTGGKAAEQKGDHHNGGPHLELSQKGQKLRNIRSKNGFPHWLSPMGCPCVWPIGGGGGCIHGGGIPLGLGGIGGPPMLGIGGG